MKVIKNMHDYNFQIILRFFTQNKKKKNSRKRKRDQDKDVKFKKKRRIYIDLLEDNKPFKDNDEERMNVDGWDVNDILCWFVQIGYGKYVDLLKPQFEEHEMDGEGLKLIEMEDLIRYGIKKFSDGKKIINHIKKL